jgi:hypothetical protein
MKKNYSLSVFAFVVFGCLSFYSYGTAMMDYFLLYPSRFFVGEREFVTYHKFLESAILPISVFPFLFIILLNMVLLRFPPDQVPKWLLWTSLVCLVLDLISTAFFQAPWNFELSAGKNIELMQKITDTNWGRVILESTQAILVGIMFYRNATPLYRSPVIKADQQ